MGTVGTVLLIALLVVAGLVVMTYVGIAVAGATELHATKRHERAARRDWVKQDSDPALVTRFRAGPFGVGRDRTATEVFRGEHGGRSFVAFDYALTDDTGDQAVRRNYTVVALELGASPPPLSFAPLQPEIPLFQEYDAREVAIDHFSFPRAYRVRAADADFARALLHPLAIQEMLCWPVLGWRIEDGALVVVRAAEGDDALATTHKLDMMTRVLDKAPPEIWERDRD